MAFLAVLTALAGCAADATKPTSSGTVVQQAPKTGPDPAVAVRPPARPAPPPAPILSPAQRRRLDEQANRAGDALMDGDLAAAERDARAVLQHDPLNSTARGVMRSVAAQRALHDAEEAQLASKLARPVSLALRDVPLRSVFEHLSRDAGIDFVLDPSVRADVPTTVVARDGRLADVVQSLLSENRLERKTLSGGSLLIYPAARAGSADAAHR